MLSAMFSLVSEVFAHPNDDDTIANIKLMNSLVQFLEKLKRKSCDVDKLLDGCTKLVKISKSLVYQEQNILQEEVQVVTY
jgi:hypothetical protein